MNVSIEDGRRLACLLELAEPEQARRARTRLGALVRKPATAAELRGLLRSQPPLGVWLWVLRCDEPEWNAVAFDVHELGDAVRRDILNGVPFGPGRTEPVPLAPSLRGGWNRRAGHPDFDLPEPLPVERLLLQLRIAGEDRQLGRARQLAGAVRRDRPTGGEPGDWDAVARADREDPLPGYARWALACRLTCPPALREQFGSHPKFTHRLRQAGVLVDALGYAEQRPAKEALLVLGALSGSGSAEGARIRERLTPSVREHLGGHAEAWAVLAQLLPTFSGTLPELIATAGAVAGPDPDLSAGDGESDGDRLDSNQRVPVLETGAPASALRPRRLWGPYRRNG